MNPQVRRMVAGLIDLLIMGVVTASLQGFLYSIIIILRMFGLMQDFHFWKASTLIGIVFITAYETICLTYAKGKTIGKLVVGLQVVEIQQTKEPRQNENVSTNPILDFYTCFLRSIVKAIMIRSFGGIFFLLNIGLVAFHQTSWMAYDHIAQTTVIQ